MSTSLVSRSQLSRLLQLLIAIRGENYPNARRLAEICEVSRRTVYRDLEALEAAGVPVEYLPERQGYRLTPGWSFDPPGLEEREVLGLLVLSRRGGDGLLGLGRDARSGVRKLMHVLPEAARRRLLGLADAIGRRPGPAEPAAEREAIHETLLAAIAQRRKVRIRFRAADGRREATKLSPYRLLFARNGWWVVGRSSLDREVRTFRLARIDRAEPTADPFEIPPRFCLDRHLGHAWDADRGDVRHQVHLRFAADLAAEVADEVGGRPVRLVPNDDGTLDLHAAVDGLDEILTWVLAFGDRAEVLGPPELRRRLVALAANLHARYANEPPNDEPSGS